MIITIPPWEALVTKFGLDMDGDIGIDPCLWVQSDELVLNSKRSLEISDEPDSDGDYLIITNLKGAAYIQRLLFEFIQSYTPAPTFGSTKHLRRPYAQTDRRDR